jgi:hypothetical protein
MPDEGNHSDRDLGRLLTAGPPATGDFERQALTGEVAAAQRAQVHALEGDPVRFMGLGLPFKASLWLALTRTSTELAERREDGSIPAIVAIGEAIVRRAVVDDLPAVAMIADRIEGRPVERADDLEPEHEARRVETSAIIEDIVESLTRSKLEEESVISPDVPRRTKRAIPKPRQGPSPFSARSP